jgi:uncharacterized protein (UPF0276 family)
LLQFLEVGVDLERGVDAATRAWVRAGAPTTYHFLDLNLEESDDLEPAWIAAARDLARELGAAWLCGDAGLWHVGPRDRGHGVLLPPVLTAESARALARNVRLLREASGLEVLPENPPAHAYAGDLHLLDYFARVADGADAGLLLDVAHLAIYQRATGRAPLDGLDGFPLDRVVEVHVAGGTEFEFEGRRFIDDDHAPEPLADTWQILEAVLPRARNLCAIVYECERNARSDVLSNFERLRSMLGFDEPRRSPSAGRAIPLRSRSAAATPFPRSEPEASGEVHRAGRVRRVQRALVRMQHDASFAERMGRGEPEAIASAQLDATGTVWLRALDPVAVAADRDGKRAAQLLRNVVSEFRISAAVGPAGDGDAWTRAFPRSAFFHAAIARDTSLPLAFAAFAEVRAGAGAEPLFAALLALEAAMARARRRAEVASPPPPGALFLSGAARLLDVPAGTFAAAAQLGAWLDRGAPLDALACADFACEHDVARADLDAVVAEYVAEGVLLRGDGRT